MRNFYRITHSLNPEILGNLDQVVIGKYSCSIYDEHFIDQIFFEKAKFDPITAKVILAPGSKLTDLIKTSIVGIGLKLLLSGKFKSILEQNVHSGVEFFESPIFKDGIEFSNYYVLNAYENRLDKVDFSKSEILLRNRKKSGGTETVLIEIKSLTQFLFNQNLYQTKGGFLFINKLVLKKTEEDFILIRNVQGGAGYFVSDRLKCVLEENKCSGLEFMPSELSQSEWLKVGGKRENIYGKPGRNF